MAYQKMTPAEWLERVRKGEFSSASKAAKSMGRAAWSDETKKKMKSYVELHFAGGKISDKDILLAGDDGGVPDPKPKRSRGKKVEKSPKEKAVAVPEKARQPAKIQPVEMLEYTEDGGIKIEMDPIADILNTIRVAHAAMSAFKTAHDANPDVGVPDELYECVDMVSACVRAIEVHIPLEVREALDSVRADIAAAEKAEAQISKKKIKEPVPKAQRVAPPAALPPKREPRLDGVPLESNQEGDELWRKLADRPKRSNGKQKRD